MNLGQNTIRVCKALILSYLVMLICMLILSLAVWKMELSEGILKGAVIFLYVVSVALGGFYIGKMQKEKKFLWGLLTGSLFFLILFVITVFSGDYSGKIGIHFVTTCCICIFSGTLGGMLA